RAPAVWKLQARRRLVSENRVTQRVEWAIELSRPNGSSAGRNLYSSVIPAHASPDTQRALALAAASINADLVIGWLNSERERVLALTR
ncbi:MAG: hypothetical protein H0T52_10105, partial [Lautropia sp.]|nr:hypothetical protein [Lautropia sp.]